MQQSHSTTFLNGTEYTHGWYMHHVISRIHFRFLIAAQLIRTICVVRCVFLCFVGVLNAAVSVWVCENQVKLQCNLVNYYYFFLSMLLFLAFNARTHKHSSNERAMIKAISRNNHQVDLTKTILYSLSSFTFKSIEFFFVYRFVVLISFDFFFIFSFLHSVQLFLLINFLLLPHAHSHTVRTIAIQVFCLCLFGVLCVIALVTRILRSYVNNLSALLERIRQKRHESAHLYWSTIQAELNATEPCCVCERFGPFNRTCATCTIKELLSNRRSQSGRISLHTQSKVTHWSALIRLYARISQSTQSAAAQLFFSTHENQRQ